MASYTTGNPEDIGPKSELLPPGQVDFEVVEADARVSKAGNDMISMVVKVRADNGSKGTCFENLVFQPNCFWNIDAFRAARGEDLTEGEDVEITPESVIGSTGQCIIAQEKITMGKRTGEMKNIVKVWIARKEDGTARGQAVTAGAGAAKSDPWG